MVADKDGEQVSAGDVPSERLEDRCERLLFHCAVELTSSLLGVGCPRREGRDSEEIDKIATDHELELLICSAPGREGLDEPRQLPGPGHHRRRCSASVEIRDD